MSRKPKSRKSFEQQMVGEEPIIKGKSESTSQVISAFNWYNYTCDQEKSVEFLVDYLIKVKKPQATIDKIRLISSKIPKRLGFMARMLCNGFIPSSDEVESFRKSFVELIKLADEAPPAVVEENHPKPVVNVQDRTREITRALIGDLEVAIDEARDKNFKNDFNPDKWFEKNNVAQVHAGRIASYYGPIAAELQEAFDGSDPDLTESYAHLSPHILKKYQSFVSSIVKAADAWYEAKRQVRKPRATKPKSVEKILAKVQYQERCPEFGIASVHPSKVIGSTEVWVFNTKYRKITVLKSDATFTIEGTTIHGVDDKQSKSKRVRKPEQFFTDVKGFAKRTLLKSFNDLKTKEDDATGRLGQDTVILAVF